MDNPPRLTGDNMNGNTDNIGYANAFGGYADLGWQVLPLPRGSKKPPPDGYTGKRGLAPSYADMQTWADSAEFRDGNLALRLPPDVIGIDVDCYNGKRGATTLDEAERRWGKLPYSPHSTARKDGSRTRLYRIPEGVKLREAIEFKELGLGDIEVIQHHHRYVVCWPSIHPEGNRYRWHGSDGAELDTPPALAELPELPNQWLDALRATAPESPELAAESPAAIRKCLTEGDMSPRVTVKPAQGLSEVFGPSRHDHIVGRVLGLLRLGKQGEPGVRTALNALSEGFVNHVHKNRPGGKDEAVAEFKSFVYGDEVPRLLADPAYDDEPAIAESDDSGEADGFDRALTLTSPDDIASDIPDWIWEYGGNGRIQRGVLTLFAGRPGAGKSTGARWFAAQLTRGELDGCWKHGPQRIAYIAGEEALEYVVKPGLQVAGADMARVVFPEVKIAGETVALMSDTDEAELTRQLLAAGVNGVFVDPIMATIRAKVDIYRNNELRQALAPWVRIARRINGAVIGVVHLNKGTSRDVVASVNGSSGFGEVARCVFGFAKDPECEPERVMSQAKNSCGAEDLSLTYEIESALFTADTGRKGLMPRFKITGESDTTVGDILAAGEGKRGLSPKMRQVVELVNSRTETSAAVLVEKKLASKINTATQTLNRLYRRGFIDNPIYGMYCPKVTPTTK
jgi:Bifunctional DNA primase/polymerase, N-terminal/AAA domain